MHIVCPCPTVATYERHEGNPYPNGVVVVPSDLLGELAEEAVLVPRLQPQNPTNNTDKIPSDTEIRRVPNQEMISITNEKSHT